MVSDNEYTPSCILPAISFANQKYDSVAGRNLCKQILAQHLPYDPHDYQLDGVCAVLDNQDLLATTPTGSGKTGFFIQLMIIARELALDPTLAINDRMFPKDPAMLVVCPTKALENDMVSFLSAILHLRI